MKYLGNWYIRVRTDELLLIIKDQDGQFCVYNETKEKIEHIGINVFNIEHFTSTGTWVYDFNRMFEKELEDL